MTGYGNTWVSDDPWGWAVYHYGRWTYNSYYGWVWVPGLEWAPAWVTWRYGGGFCGWAPMGPGVAVGVATDVPATWWVFVSSQHLYQPNCFSYWRGVSYNPIYLRQTAMVGNYYVDNSTKVRYHFGPRTEELQRDTRQPVQEYRVQQTNRPGAPSVAGNVVSLYRPRVNNGTVRTSQPASLIRAPRAVGRPQPATQYAVDRQQAFRLDMQRMGIKNNFSRPMSQQGNGSGDAAGAEPVRDGRELRTNEELQYQRGGRYDSRGVSPNYQVQEGRSMPRGESTTPATAEQGYRESQNNSGADYPAPQTTVPERQGEDMPVNRGGRVDLRRQDNGQLPPARRSMLLPLRSGTSPNEPHREPNFLQRGGRLFKRQENNPEERGGSWGRIFERNRPANQPVPARPTPAPQSQPQPSQRQPTIRGGR